MLLDHLGAAIFDFLKIVVKMNLTGRFGNN